MFQYTTAAWTVRLAQLNAANGTSFTLTQLPVAVVNAVIIAADNDQELARHAVSTFSNLVTLRHLLYVANAADPGIAVITTFLGQMQTRWPDDITSIPAV